MTTTDKSWVTLATNDSYALGALVLAHSLKNVGTKHQLTILITPGVTASMKEQIHKVFNDVKVVDVLDSKDEAHLALMSRPELGITFTKLHCWTLTHYEKCVFLDADTLVLQNCDELFDREELSAAPDPGWPDCFNSGVFVFKPSLDTFKQLIDFAKSKGSFDGGDQGLLNLFFKDWAFKDISKHLSFTYNVVWSSTYSYLPALKQFGQNMKIVHFIASSKPWLQKFDVGSRIVTPTTGGTGLQALLQFWWDLFCKHVHPVLSTQMGGLAAQFANLSLGEKSADQQALEDFLRRQSWEHGNVDYLGKDSFSNIWAKINETLETPSESKVEPDIDTASTPASLEVVHTQEIKPLKSALKKTSTASQPDQSELVGGSIETTSKPLEKLDIKKDDCQESKVVPSTPTVTSPTPPTTPASQLQESSKPIEPSHDTSTPVESPVEPPKEILKPVEPESIESKPKEDIKDTVQQSKESSVATEEKQDSDEPPVPPKRTHKPSGSDGSKNEQPPQEK